MVHTVTCGLTGLIVATLVATEAWAADGRTNAVRDGRVEAELLTQDTALIRGTTEQVGVRLTMDEGWHTYWKNPGDSGMATSITWDLPEGFVAGEIEWPVPEYFEVGGLASYAYEGEILLPVKIEVPEAYAADEVTLRAKVDWLVCKEQCEPGSVALEVTVPVGSRGEISTFERSDHARFLFQWADTHVPKRFIDPAIEAEVGDDEIKLHLGPKLTGFGFGLGQAVRFFPDSPRLIDMVAPQQIDYDADTGYTLTLVKNPLFDPELRAVTGVVTFNGNDWPLPYRIDARFRDVAEGEND